MASASKGDTVRVHDTGRLSDGTVFDSSEGRDPLVFEVGSGQVISGFESSVEGMEVGETKTITIPAGEAYGQRRDDLVMNVASDQVPEGMDPAVGQRLMMQTSDGKSFPVVVLEVTDQSVAVDANHPLAGKDLTFDVQLVAVA